MALFVLLWSCERVCGSASPPGQVAVAPLYTSMQGQAIEP